MREGRSLDKYHLLGRSGLRVSPLALGTMTFGRDWGWGSDLDEARSIFDAYIERGGNFIDTANQYTNGKSEEFVGKFAVGRRDRLVIATKYALPSRAGDPNSGGNHRKSMIHSAERSLKRLATEYIDLLYLHCWDSTTPVDEILRAMDDLVRSGKVLYLGISNTPAWQIARLQTTAELRGWTPLIALQIEYNLIARTVERELIPMASEIGLGVIPWSPLAEGILAGKYTHADLNSTGAHVPGDGSRRSTVIAGGTVTERNLAIADVVKEVATEIGKTSAQVALAWLSSKCAVTSIIVGARTLQQLNENLGSLDVELTGEQQARFDRAGRIELGFPHDWLTWLETSEYMYGGVNIVPRGK